MIRRSVSFAAAALAMALPLSSSAKAGGAVEIQSVSSSENLGNGASDLVSVSADGRFVAFQSFASNLVPNDTNADFGGFGLDVFVRDRLLGTTERVSVSSTGEQAYGSNPFISANGRFVVFQSNSSNLPGDPYHYDQIYVHDRETGTTELTSLTSDESTVNGGSDRGSITPDGRYVVFASTAPLAPPATHEDGSNVYVRDRVAGITELISASTSGAVGNEESSIQSDPVISADGRYVAFESAASNLVRRDTNGTADVFLRDRAAARTIRISVSSRERQARGESLSPSICRDGHLVVFHSTAANLVSGDVNGSNDVFVRDWTTGTTEMASVSSSGNPGNLWSGFPSIAGDGLSIAFASRATNLVAAGGNGRIQVFLRDLVSGTTRRVSTAPTGQWGNGDSSWPFLSSTGAFLGFSSYASNLVATDTNGTSDAFLRVT